MAPATFILERALHLAVAIEIGAGSLATADGNLDANARRQGLTTVMF